MKAILQTSLTLFLLIPGLASSSTRSYVDDTTGAHSWETDAHGVHFSMTQILPDQLYAFYINRGFSQEQIQAYASSCVFMTVLRNDMAPGTIHFIRANWSVESNGKTHALLSIDDWINRFTDNNIGKSSMIAFRWAQFPPEQEYEPGGDWNQGMLSVGLPAETQFNITATWDIKGEAYEATLKGVKCAR